MEWKLLEPILIGGKRAKNRIVMAPMETRLSTITGDITQAMIDYYAQRAKGGAGVIIVENTFIDNKQLTFRGTGMGFFGNWLLIIILSVITLGIYIPWGFCRMRRWLVENLYFAEDADIEKGVPCRASTRKSEKDKVIPAKKAVDAFYCTQCGTKNESSSKFCIECGSKI